MRSRVCAALLLLSGCGVTNPEYEPFSVAERAEAPKAGAQAEAVAHALPAPATLIAGGPDYVIASTDQGPFRLVGADEPVPMRLVRPGGSEPAGALRAAASRQVGQTAPATGVLVLGEAGLLQDYTDWLEVSPADTAVPDGASALDSLGAGSDEVIWVGVPGGAVRITRTGSQRFSLPGLAGAPSAVLQVDENLALVAFPGVVYALRFQVGRATALPYSFGPIAAATRGDSGSALLAGENGLFVRDAGGSWTHYATGPVSGLAFDAINGAFLATDRDLLALRDGALEKVGAFPEPGPHPLGIDGFGDVWAASGKAVLDFRVGSPVSYTNQLKPFFSNHCYECHVTGAVQSSPRLPLDDYDGTKGLIGTILQRVSGAGGSPMPPPPPLGKGQLSPKDYGVLIRWARSGEQK